MKKNVLFLSMCLCFALLSKAQTQSLVIQKNTLPNANQNFTFATSGPVGSAFAANPTITLHDEFGGKQPLEVGASSSGTGYLAFTQKDAPVNDVYTYTSGNAAWVHPAGNNAVRIDIETSGINWQINSSNNIYRNGVLSGTAKDVGVGPDNGVYVVGTDDKLYKWVSGSTYTALAGSPQPTGKRIDGGPSGTAWYIGLDNHVYYYNGTSATDNGLPGGQSAKDIAVGADGTAWAIAVNPANVNYDIIYYWNGSAWTADALAPTGTTMYNVTVGADNEPLMTLSFNGGRSYLLKRLSDGRWVVISAQTAGLNNTLIYYNQPTGNYSFTETVASGYYLQDIIIFGSTGDSYSTTTGTSSISVGANEHVYVQYTNVLGTKPAAQTISTACGGTFIETFGTGSTNVVNSLPAGQTSYTFNNNPMGHYQGNGVNDGQYVLTTSVYDATGYYYQWISGPGLNGANCSYTCDVHGDVSYGLSKVASDTDHTAGDVNGQMLLVNADFSSGVYYEKEYAGLVPGNSYRFSAWLANVLLAAATDATDPNVILRVVDPTTGAILLDLPSGDIPKTGSTLTWIEKKGSFIAPASGNVRVYLINNKPGGQGNDLVLDDISLTATCQTITGKLYNDANGLADGLVNGIGTNTTSTLYAILVDATNHVVNSVLLPSTGEYSFSNLFSGNYSVKLSTTAPGGVGTIAPNSSMTAGWIHTGNSKGNNNGAGSGNVTTGNLDSTYIVVGTADVTNVDFGIEKAPTANTVTAIPQVNPGGTNTVVVPTLNGSDPEQGVFDGDSKLDTVIIKTLPTNATLYYDFGAGFVALVAGDTIKNYDPSLLVVDPNNGGLLIVTFTYVEVDAALISSTAATVTMTFTPLLPVALIDFTGQFNNKKVDLKWSTSTETNVDYFVVERSADGNSFAEVGTMGAKGIASVYQFADVLPFNGVNYYRVKTTDNDGRITYSKVIVVKATITNRVTISGCKPNPFVNKVDVYIDLLESAVIKINMVDAVGRSVYQHTVKGAKGLNWVNIDNLENLSSGIYIIRVNAGNVGAQQKIIKRDR
ncbi:T9SS type A sorting domain-containing protein [Ferruginibacter lapsinanis]|uniref:T9SS type A sorting domain-containing protein n=1 Tax=Ferruginibacter lapsinanis TaxID=563172 RepID=UPI001E4151BF|nr:T9SS type A sorting domain-containing protein [Ferruginibacter lapsinanis]UEG50183.1 T9SS type A sorting domain-containing protein [Ferruginibacter lapsinanis]